jgi:hypothetical protein
VLDQRTIAHANLTLLEHRGDRHDDRELLRVAFEVVGHCDDGLVVVTHEHDLGGLVEQPGVRLGDVEAAEREHRGRRERDDEHTGHERDQVFHGELLHS